MSAAVQVTAAWDNLEHCTDEELAALIGTVERMLADRKRQRQEAAKKRALSILKEAGLDLRLTGRPKKGE
jgi:hypothetical protein